MAGIVECLRIFAINRQRSSASSGYALFRTGLRLHLRAINKGQVSARAKSDGHAEHCLMAMRGSVSTQPKHMTMA